MGLIVSKIAQLFNFEGPQRRVLLLGLDAAGKTTILYKLKLDETVTTIPTIGFNVEEIKIPGCGVNFCVWDVGGQERLRPLWRHYFRGTAGLIFVVDSADRERFDEARNELHSVLNDPEMDRIPVVVFANKQDLPTSLNIPQICEELKIGDLKMKGHDWHVQACAAINGHGLLEGFQEMSRLSREFLRNNDRLP